MSDCLSCTPDTSSYATIDDLRSAGLPPAALANVELSDQQAALVRASKMADTYMRDRYTLPFRCPYDPALIDAVVQIAAWRLMSRRGFNPNSGADIAIRQGYDDSIKFLTRVANGQAQLCVRQAAPESLQPVVGTNVSRGYGGTGGEDLPFTGPNTWGF